MNCEKSSTCPIFAKHQDKLCARLYCQDLCPKPRDIDPAHGMSKAAGAQKGNDDATLPE